MEKDSYKTLYQIEDKHWWFVARRNIIYYLIKRIIQPSGEIKILDIGCGTGREIDFFESLGEVIGIDKSQDALDFCKQRGLGTKTIQMDARELTFENATFDLILCLDVLEHIAHPGMALSEAYRVLKPGGYAVFTVPAFMFLWSEHDKKMGHYRRYTIEEFRQSLKKASFDIIKISYFDTFLFPIIFLIRKLKNILKISKGVTSESFVPRGALNYILKYIFESEKYFLRRLRFPLGVSIIAIVKK